MNGLAQLRPSIPVPTLLVALAVIAAAVVLAVVLAELAGVWSATEAALGAKPLPPPPPR